MVNRWVVVGALSGFIGVAMGAFGAHGLTKILSEKNLAVFHTGAQYQMYHALALIAVGLWSAHTGRAMNLAGWSFFFGTLLFSGSLYVLAITDVRTFGAITPVGGVLFLLGWGAFAFNAARSGV